MVGRKTHYGSPILLNDHNGVKVQVSEKDKTDRSFYQYTPLCNPSWLKWSVTLLWEKVTCKSCLSRRPTEQGGE